MKRASAVVALTVPLASVTAWHAPAQANPDVPRLVRVARLEALMPGGCDGWRPAALSADGYTAALSCGSHSDEGTVAILSALPSGVWRVTARIGGGRQMQIALAADGDTLAIRDVWTARARIFTRTDGLWRKTGALATALVPYSHESMALSPDGSRLALGGFAHRREQVEVFGRTPTGWSRQALLSSPAGREASFGGGSSSLSMTAGTLVVAAPSDDADQGAVFVYQRSGATWRLRQRLESSAGTTFFGTAVALAGDGGTIAVSGSHGVSVFRARASGAADFGRVAQLPTGGDAPSTVTMSRDGRAVVAGLPFRDVRGVFRAGRVYRFVRGESGWRFGGVLDPPAGDRQYGAALGVEATGRRVLVAARWPTVDTRGVAADLYQVGNQRAAR